MRSYDGEADEPSAPADHAPVPVQPEPQQQFTEPEPAHFKPDQADEDVTFKTEMNDSYNQPSMSMQGFSHNDVKPDNGGYGDGADAHHEERPIGIKEDG